MGKKDFVPYFKILEKHGWHREDDQLYSPYGTSWISGDENLPLFMVESVHKTLRSELQRMLKSADKEKLERNIKDMANQIRIMEKIIAENSQK